MRSRKKSPTPSRRGKSSMPLTWREELATQAALRKEIAQTQKRYDAARAEAAAGLVEGGIGWPSRVGTAELVARTEWDHLRALLLALYTRKVVA